MRNQWPSRKPPRLPSIPDNGKGAALSVIEKTGHSRQDTGGRVAQW